MGMNSLIREYLFILVFQRDFYTKRQMENQVQNCIDSLELVDAINSGELTEEDKSYIVLEYEKILENMSKIDTIIKKNMSGWKLERIGKVELALLRLSVFEVMFDKSGNYRDIFNEIVELSKCYANAEGYRFVNGVLGNIYKNEMTGEVDE